MIVLDASAAAYLVADVEPAGESVAKAVEREAELHAPELLDAEVLGALRRWVITKSLSQRAADGAVQELMNLQLVRYPHRPFVERAWSLRGRLTPYDALYVALAEALDATLVTCDRRLARAVTTVDVVVPV